MTFRRRLQSAVGCILVLALATSALAVLAVKNGARTAWIHNRRRFPIAVAASSRVLRRFCGNSSVSNCAAVYVTFFDLYNKGSIFGQADWVG